MIIRTQDWKRRLRSLFSSAQKGTEYHFDRLYNLIHPPSHFDLLQELNILSREGGVDILYRIVSPQTGQGLLESKDLTDFPLYMKDESSGVNIKVQLSRDVELLYKPSQFQSND